MAAPIAAPPSTAGARRTAISRCHHSTLPAAARAAMDSTVPIGKATAKVERISAAARCWVSSASGGPPTAAVVSIAPAIRPAVIAVTGVVDTSGAANDSAAAATTTAPTSTDRRSCGMRLTSAAPTAMPGSRPTEIQPMSGQSMACRSRRAIDQ